MLTRSQTVLASVSGPNRPSCQALAGRHGTSGGTDAGALRPFCIALAPLSYELRPARGAFFCPREGVLPALRESRTVRERLRFATVSRVEAPRGGWCATIQHRDWERRLVATSSTVARAQHAVERWAAANEPTARRVMVDIRAAGATQVPRQSLLAEQGHQARAAPLVESAHS